MKEKYKNILVVNTFGIGDVLFTTPVLKALKERFPGARLDYICNRRTSDLLKSNTRIDKIIVFEKDEFRRSLEDSKIGFLKELKGFIQKIRHNRYDIAISFSLGYQMGLVLALSGIPRRFGFNYRKRGMFLTDRHTVQGFNDKHVIEYYMDLIGHLGISCTREKNIELESNVLLASPRSHRQPNALDEIVVVSVVLGQIR